MLQLGLNHGNVDVSDGAQRRVATVCDARPKGTHRFPGILVFSPALDADLVRARSDGE